MGGVSATQAFCGKSPINIIHNVCICRPVHFINLVPRIVYIGGSNCMVTQGGSGHSAVYYISPQSFIITFLIRWLIFLGTINLL